MRRDGTIRHRAGRALAATALVLLAWTAVVALSGGVTLHAGGWRLVARDPWRPFTIATGLFVAAAALLGVAEVGRLARGLAGGPHRAPARAAALAAAATVIVSIAWNTRAVGGSDSSCYVLQAEAFARGKIALPVPLADLPPDLPPVAFAPTGFVPSPAPPFEPVPICAPGLALLMVPAFLVNREAVFYVTPLFAALAVWCTFLLGRAVDDDVTGACAAVLLACSPIFLYQAVQPMSDVPAAALWLAALAALAPESRRDPRISVPPARLVLAGVAASTAVLMRPNVALIVLPLLVLLPGIRGWLWFGAASLPALAALAALNALRYGSPLASGYGSTDVLFSLAHVSANLARYPRWLLETHTPLLALAALAPVLLWRRGDRRFLLAATAAVVLTMATYLAYTVFDDWWYIRFLLPALPVLLVFTVGSLRALVARVVRANSGPAPVIAIILICAALAGWFVTVARNRLVFDLAGLESRFRLTGEYAGRALPSRAIVLAVQQSASIRYYGGRATMTWDGIPANRLESTIEGLTAAGHRVLFALEDVEEPRFRARFAGQRFGALDWPPSAEVHAPVRVRFYDAADRAPFLSGGRITTEHVR